MLSRSVILRSVNIPALCYLQSFSRQGTKVVSQHRKACGSGLALPSACLNNICYAQDMAIATQVNSRI